MVWYWKGKEEFWICRVGKERYDKELKKTVVAYDSMPALDMRCRNEGIKQWLENVAKWLMKREGMSLNI